MPLQRLKVEAPPEARGRRLDQFLADVLGQSRSRVQRRIVAGDIVVDDRRVNASQRLNGREVITVAAEEEQEAASLEAEPFDARLAVVAEEADYIVLAKPPGLVVHPGAGHDRGTLAHQLLSRYPEIAAVGHPMRPGIVHRLDVGTSGVIVVARTQHGYQTLSKAFSSREVRKRYLAIVYGSRIDEMEIDLPIGRHPTDRKRMAVRAGGRGALSRVRPLASGNGLSLVEIELHTGRTHQIRVHLKAAKHPLIGDPTYGEARWKAFPTRDQPALRDFGRPALHAWKLAFHDPAAKPSSLDGDTAAEQRKIGVRRFTVEAPEDMQGLWERLVGAWPL